MKLFVYIFGGVGLALVIGSAFSFIHSRNFIANSETSEGIVTQLNYHRDSDGGGTYYPMVQFRTQTGSIFNVAGNTGSNPAAYSIGETVKVYYDPENPTDIMLPDFFSIWGVTLILGGLGLVFSMIGGAVGLSIYKQKVNTEWLQKHGESVQAQFSSISLNTNLTINGRNPFVIYCQWVDTLSNKVYVFQSKNIWFDPAPYISQTQLKVLIDPKNPKKRHYVDLSFLPQEA